MIKFPASAVTLALLGLVFSVPAYPQPLALEGILRSEHQQQPGGGKPDRISGEGIHNIGQMLGGRFKSRVVRKPDQQGDVQEDKEREAERVYIEPQPPHLHRHEHRKGEKNCSPESTRKSNCKASSNGTR
jgi:hypothetical protein